MSDAFPLSQPVPVTILTGFLGAGKTTLLNRMLRADHGLRVAVLVNDFGAVNIDAALVVGVEGEQVSLANGCICCSIRGDLLNAAIKLLRRPEPPEYVLIEASGVSDPVAVATTFLMPELRQLFRLDSILTVVDAEQIHMLHEYQDLIIDQIAAADLVLLNKIDLVDTSYLEQLRQWVRQIVPRARILETVHAAAPVELLLGVGKYRLPLDLLGPTPTTAHTHDHDHQQAFSSWSYQSMQPVGLREVRDFLKNLPLSVVRAKGVLATTDLPERRMVVHLVGKRISVTVGEAWSDQLPSTQLVAIATPGGLDADQLTAAFQACQRTQASDEQFLGAWEWLRGVRS